MFCSWKENLVYHEKKEEFLNGTLSVVKSCKISNIWYRFFIFFSELFADIFTQKKIVCVLFFFQHRINEVQLVLNGDIWQYLNMNLNKIHKGFNLYSRVWMVDSFFFFFGWLILSLSKMSEQHSPQQTNLTKKYIEYKTKRFVCNDIMATFQMTYNLHM